MKPRLPAILAAAAVLAACTRAAPPPAAAPAGQGVARPAAQQLPVLVATPAQAEQNAGGTVQVRGRSLASTLRGAATPALELEDRVVVLESQSEAGRAALVRALQDRPLGTRFMATGSLQLLPAQTGLRELAVLTVDTPPSPEIAATADEIAVGVWPASTADWAAVAPLVHIPLSGTPYAWWSLWLSREGTLYLEADSRGRQPIPLDEPVAALKEMLVLDGDRDSLFELVLLVQTATGHVRAIAVGASGQRLAALEAKLGTAQSTQEAFMALGTFHWPAILAGPDGAGVARVWWDEASLGAPPLHQLRLAGARFSTADEPLLRDLPPAQPLLRLRGEPDRVVVEARCGRLWRELGSRAVPAQGSRIDEALRATRSVVDSRALDLARMCAR